MATQLFLQASAAQSSAAINWWNGDGYTSLVGTLRTTPILLSAVAGVRGAGIDSATCTTVTGTTAGLELSSLGNQNNPNLWLTAPVAADATVSGSITFNVWAQESNMSANAAINVRLMRIGPTGALTEVHKTVRTTELGFSGANTVQNWAETPTSFTLNRGDRLMLVLFADDAGTMATGFTVTASYAGTTGAADGDTFVTLTETLSFESGSPSGTTVYPTDTASDVSTASVDREVWTSRGGGVQNDVTNTTAAPASPIQVTDTAGGTVVDWFTKALTAFTLAGAVLVNARFSESTTSTRAAPMCELAVVAGDGTSPTVWGSNVGIWTESTSETAVQFLVAADDLAVTNGQRLRIRFYIDNHINAPMAGSQTTTLYYAGTSGGASGDAYLTFTNTLTEFVAAVQVPYRNQMPQLLAQ
jgi:hypothetical protein